MDMRWRISRLDERRDTGVIIGHLINNQPLVPAEFRACPSDPRPCQTSGAKPSQGQPRPRRKVGAGGSGPLRTRVNTRLRGLGVSRLSVAWLHGVWKVLGFMAPVYSSRLVTVRERGSSDAWIVWLSSAYGTTGG